MNLDDYFYLGKVTKLIGYKGELDLYFDVDDPMIYTKLPSVIIKTRGTLVPYFFDELQLRREKHFKAKFQGVESEEDARELVNTELYLPLEVLPKLEGNKFYYHEILEFMVSDKTAGDIGKIQRVIDLPSNPLFEVKSDTDIEILVPINDDIIKKVDRENNRIEVDLPEGLLDLYL